MAVAKAAPGPQPPLPLHPRQPQPPLHRASSFLPCMAPRPPTGQPSPRTPCSPCTVTTPGTPSLLPCGPPQGSPSPLHPRTLASGCLGVAPCRRAQPIPTVLSSPSLLEKLQLQWQPLGCGALPGGGLPGTLGLHGGLEGQESRGCGGIRVPGASWRTWEAAAIMVLKLHCVGAPCPGWIWGRENPLPLPNSPASLSVQKLVSGWGGRE